MVSYCGKSIHSLDTIFLHYHTFYSDVLQQLLILRTQDDWNIMIMIVASCPRLPSPPPQREEKGGRQGRKEGRRETHSLLICPPLHQGWSCAAELHIVACESFRAYLERVHSPAYRSGWVRVFESSPDLACDCNSPYKSYQLVCLSLRKRISMPPKKLKPLHPHTPSVLVAYCAY